MPQPHPLLGLLLLLVCGAAWAQDGAEEIVPPEVVDAPTPTYPEAAFEADVEADVIFDVEIDAEGRPGAIEALELILYSFDEEGEVQESSVAVDEDPWGFVASAREALAAYRFSPARRIVPGEEGEGEPIPVLLTWRVGFVINQEVIASFADEDEADEDAAGTAEGVGMDPSGPVNLAGRVVERGTRDVIPAALVAVERIADPEGAPLEEDAYAEVRTDDAGRFALRGLPPGRWALVIEAGGYERVRIEETVAPGERTDVTLYLELDDPAGRMVTRSVGQPPAREVTRRRIDPVEVRRIPGNTGDAIRVVQNLPGVARPAFGGGSIVVRGSNEAETFFFIDDVPIPQVYHFGGIRAVFPTEIVESVDLYPGAFSARYGRATGAALVVTTRPPREDRIGGFAEVNVFDAGAFFEGPITDTLSFQVGARRSYIDALLLPLADTLNLNFTTAPRYWDTQGRLQWRPNRDHSISLLLYASDDLLDFLLGDETPLEPDQRGGIRAQLFFRAALVSWDARLSDTVRNELRLQIQQQRLAFSLGSDIRFNLDALFNSVRNTTEVDVLDNLTLRGGVDVLFGPAELDLRAPRPPREGQATGGRDTDERLEVGTEVTVFQPAMFAEADVEVGDRLLLVPGARLDYFSNVDRWGAAGRLSARYSLSEIWTAKAAVGTFNNAPQPDESDPTRTFGNPDLRLPWAIHYVAGIELEMPQGLEISGELFYKDLRSQVSRTDEVAEIDGEVRPLIYDNEGRGRVVGFELFARQQLSRNFFGWVAYTLSRSERQDRPGDEWRVFDFDQTHILTALGSYNLPRNWSIGARFRLVTGNPQTPFVGAVYDAERDNFLPIPGAANSERLPVFHQLDLRVDKRWIFDRWILNGYLDIQNVYNRANAEAFAYSYDFSQRDVITGLPLIPSLGLRAEF